MRATAESSQHPQPCSDGRVSFLSHEHFTGIRQKPWSIKAAKYHLNAYIRKHFGKVVLNELTPQIQQDFVTLLSQKISRKTVLNVIGTHSSMMRTAKSWRYCAQPVTTGDLALPADEIHNQPRFLSGDQARKTISLASDPGAHHVRHLANDRTSRGRGRRLQKQDLDFEHRVIHVRRSAWYGRVQTCESKASTARVAMADALATMLEEYLATWKENAEEFLLLNRNGGPYPVTKLSNTDFGLCSTN